MIDLTATLRRYLVSQTVITNTFGPRVYTGLRLPPEYKLDQGRALLFSVRGGDVPSVEGNVLNPSLQFRAYGQTDELAYSGQLALFDVLNKAKKGNILAATVESLPAGLRDPDSDWPFSLSYYRVIFRNP